MNADHFVAFLSGGGASPFTGIITHALPHVDYGSKEHPVILVLPNGNPDYYPLVANTARRQGSVGVILERGGPLCHLAVVANESPEKYAVGFLPNARELLPEGHNAIYHAAFNNIRLY